MATESLLSIDSNDIVTSSGYFANLLVVKVAERCNLNCSYCYMYNGGDKTYLKKPPLMSSAVVKAMMERTARHCRQHGLDQFDFVLHGGEPMVAKPRFYRHFVETAHRILGPDITPRFSMQTNGVLVTKEWCDVFKELGIGLSFSLDGPRAVNDRYRLDKQGRGTFDRVIDGWNVAVSEGIKPGLLMVVDVDSDPLEIYDLIKELRPKTVDFLLPDATRLKPPNGYKGNVAQETPYAQWLGSIFEAWTAEGGAGLNIRIFLQIIRALLGYKDDGYDVLGLGKIRVLVVDSDGEIQPLDGLRFCDDGITETGLNVLKNDLGEAYRIPLIRHYHDSHTNLCETCLQCPKMHVCGGGFLANRYSGEGNFMNPSVYCQDLKKIIAMIDDWLQMEMAKEASRTSYTA